MNAADRRRLTPALGIAAVVLLVVLVALWLGLGRGAHWHADAAAPRLPPLGSTTPPPAVPPLDHYAEVWQRPLFSPTRSPEPAAGGANAASGDLELTGVILLPQLRMAILHDKSTGKDYRVIQGRLTRGAPALLELHPRSAVVEAAGSRLSLQLVPGPAPGAGAADATGGAQPADAEVQGASAMVTRLGDAGSGQRGPGSANRAAAAARARQLKARIEAGRRAADGQDGGG